MDTELEESDAEVILEENPVVIIVSAPHARRVTVTVDPRYDTPEFIW